MGRYLDDQTLKTYLNLGKRVEVFLGRDKSNSNIINHLDIYKEEKTIKVDLYQYFENEYLPFYEFPEVKEKSNYLIGKFDSVEAMKIYIAKRFQVSQINFVNSLMCEDEYQKMIEAEPNYKPKPILAIDEEDDDDDEFEEVIIKKKWWKFW